MGSIAGYVAQDVTNVHVDPLKVPQVTFKTVSDDYRPNNVARVPYKIVEQPSRLNRKIRIIVVGAGASAINFAHEVSQSKLDLHLTCYDKNPSVGGTWYENRYPGCGCDIPSVNYQLSWAPSPKWSSL
jgi:hypothetical protein